MGENLSVPRVLATSIDRQISLRDNKNKNRHEGSYDSKLSKLSKSPVNSVSSAKPDGHENKLSNVDTIRRIHDEFFAQSHSAKARKRKDKRNVLLSNSKDIIPDRL